MSTRVQNEIMKTAEELQAVNSNNITLKFCRYSIIEILIFYFLKNTKVCKLIEEKRTSNKHTHNDIQS